METRRCATGKWIMGPARGTAFGQSGADRQIRACASRQERPRPYSAHWRVDALRSALPRLAGFSLLAIVLAAVAAAAQAGDPSPPVLGGIRPLDLPEELTSAADVRWRPDGSLLFGLERDGIYSWRPGTGVVELEATLSGTTYGRASRYGNYSRLGGSTASGIVFAGDLFGVYRRHDGLTTPLKQNLEIVGDLDHRDGRTVTVGLARRPRPSPAPGDIWEPYIAWLIGADGAERGLLPTRDGGGALEACHAVELTISRFVANDLVLVIPGAEPGAFLYGTDGSLRGTVDAEALSATRPDCEPERRTLLRDEEFRTVWLRRHRFIDDVVANDEGDVFFFVRHVKGGQPPSGVDETASNGAVEVTTILRADAARTAKEVAEDVGSAEGIGVRRVAVALDGLDLSELAAGASEGEAVVLSGEQAARVLALAKARADRDEAASAPRASVCWDIVHARVDDLRRTATAPCAVTSDRADARLRVDLLGDRAVLLIRGAARLGSRGVGRPAAVFEARILAGS